MLLVLIFVLSAAALTVLLWVGTLFFQGYIYTEPTRDIHWQAPAAGGVLALFLTLWCLLVVNSTDPVTQEIAYDTLLRFSPRAEKYNKPVKELWVERNKQIQKYELDKSDPLRVRYRLAGTGIGFPSARVTAIIIKDQSGEARFEPVPAPAGSQYTEFRDADGWTMKVDPDGPYGTASKFRWDRFLANLFLNLLHLVLWFVCLWLLLRFQWSHALGMGFVMWLVMTLAILPMLFEQAAMEARRKALAQAHMTPASRTV